MFKAGMNTNNSKNNVKTNWKLILDSLLQIKTINQDSVVSQSQYNRLNLQIDIPKLYTSLSKYAHKRKGKRLQNT